MTHDTTLRDTVAGAAVGMLATWAVARVTGHLYKPSNKTRRARGKQVATTGAASPLTWALTLGSGAVFGALRVRAARSAGQALMPTLFWVFGATVFAAIRKA
jgi:hypothetical protein